MMHAQEAQPPGRGYLTAEEAAAYLGCGVDYLYTLCAAGQIRYARMGRAYRIRRAALDEYILAREEETMRAEHNIREIRR